MKAAMHTENISRSGILIAWRGVEQMPPLPALGQIITVEIELPANHGFGQKCIHCQGLVTRAGGNDPECQRVALRVNYMDFRSFHDQIRVYESLRPVANTWMA
jgi:hypothetical protein